MSWRRISWRACVGGGRLCLSGLHAVLLLLALLQALVIASVHFIGSVHIPGIAADLLRSQFARQGISVEWANASLGLTGKLNFTGLELRERSSGNLILQFEQLHADLDMTRLLRGASIPLESIFGSQVSYFLPPELSGSGGSEADITISEIHLERRFRVWRLNRALVRIGDVELAVRGNLNPPDVPADPSITVGPAWRESGRRLAPGLRQIRQLPAMQGKVRLRTSLAGTLQLEASADCPTWTLSPGKSLHEAFLRLPLIDLSTRQVLAPPSLRAARASLQVGGTTHALSALEVHFGGTPRRLPGGWEIGDQIDVLGRYHFTPDHPIALRATTRLGALPDGLPVSLRATTSPGSLTVDGVWDFSAARQRFALHFEGTPNELLKTPQVARGLIGQAVALSAQTAFDATLALTSKGQFEQLRFALRTIGAEVREARFDEVRLTGWIDRERLHLGPIIVHDPGEQSAAGYFLQDFETWDFRILAEGRVKPRRLDSLIPPFYRKLWETIDPGPHASFGDVDVVSRWKDPASTHALVAVRGHDVGYRGVPLDHLFLQLRQATGFVELMDLRGTAPNLRLTGQVGLSFPRRGEAGPRLQQFDLEGRLPLGVLTTLLGDQIRLAADNLTFAGPLELAAKGSMLAPAEGPAEKSLQIAARTAAPWTLREIPFDALETRFQIQPQRTLIEQFAARRDGGTFEISGELDPALTSLSISARDLPYGTFRALLRALESPPPETAEPTAGNPPSEAAEPLSGRVDLELDVRYGAPRWETLEGVGAISLREAELGRIHLFGALSRLFSSVGVNLATLRLARLDSRLELAPGRLRFPDLELAGPSVRIESPGMITLPAGQLNFAAKVFFLETENPTLRGLFGPLFRPLGHALEIDGRGTLDEPKWSFRHNPLNLFRRDETDPPEAFEGAPTQDLPTAPAAAAAERAAATPEEAPEAESLPLPTEF